MYAYVGPESILTGLWVKVYYGPHVTCISVSLWKISENSKFLKVQKKTFIHVPKPFYAGKNINANERGNNITSTGYDCKQPVTASGL